MNDPVKTLERLVSERKVRAVAWAGSFDTEQAWVGSEPYFVTFERGLVAPHTETRAGITVEHHPYEQLEAWREWDVAREQAPLALLATSRVAYDPTGLYGRVQKLLWNLSPERLAVHREELLAQGHAQLQDARTRFTRAGHGAPEQVLALVTAREVALTYLYPALLTHKHLWPEFEVRMPHAWRASVGLSFPKSVYHLDSLYAFGGETEARRVLLATRGLNLLAQEKRARAAFGAGYYDGAVRYIRDETARTHRQDLNGWAHLSGARRERLSTLLGLERSPLGPTALHVAEQLLEDVREAR